MEDKTRHVKAMEIEQLYEHIKSLSPADRLLLIEKIIHDLTTKSVEDLTQRHDWMSVRGIAPNLLRGADAQEWVSRTRHEADESRGA